MNKNSYKKSTHLTYSCRYHVIFCPKYRRKIFTNGIDTRLKEIFLNIANEYMFDIIEMEVMPDHIHLLIDCNPRFGVMACVDKLKTFSAKQLRLDFPTLKSRLPNVWTRSAFVATVGSVSLEVVKKYIAEQKNV